MTAQETYVSAIRRGEPLYWWHKAILEDVGRIIGLGHPARRMTVEANARLRSEGMASVDVDNLIRYGALVERTEYSEDGPIRLLSLPAN